MEKDKIVQNRIDLIQGEKSKSPFGSVGTQPIRLLIGAGSLNSYQLRQMPHVYKAKTAGSKKTVKKLVRQKGKKPFMQTFHVVEAEELPKGELSLKTISREQIDKFKRGEDLDLLTKLLRPLAISEYNKTGLRSLGFTTGDALSEAWFPMARVLERHKPNGPAKFSTLSTIAIHRHFIKLYQKEKKIRARQVAVENIENMDAVASAYDLSTQLEAKELRGEQIRKLEAKAKQYRKAGRKGREIVKQHLISVTQLSDIAKKDVLDLYDEIVIKGWSNEDAGKKRGVSRQAIKSKVKRLIERPIYEKLKLQLKDISIPVAEKQKFKGNGEKVTKAEPEVSSLDKGLILLYSQISRMSDGEDIDNNIVIDDSEVRRMKTRARVILHKELMKKYGSKRQHKLMYRVLNNIDRLSLEFIDHLMGYDFEDKGIKSKAGYELGLDLLTVFDSDSLPVMQYNVLIGLIDGFIRGDNNLQEIAELYREDIDKSKVRKVNRKFKREFGFLPTNDEWHNYVVINTFIEFLNSTDYKDSTRDRYLKVLPNADSKFQTIYRKVIA